MDSAQVDKVIEVCGASCKAVTCGLRYQQLRDEARPEIVSKLAGVSKLADPVTVEPHKAVEPTYKFEVVDGNERHTVRIPARQLRTLLADMGEQDDGTLLVMLAEVAWAITHNRKLAGKL
jgi:hypothetical protein